jgi:hypothetical protein
VTALYTAILYFGTFIVGKGRRFLLGFWRELERCDSSVERIPHLGGRSGIHHNP